MGLGSLFGSIGKGLRRPFKDIHKAVKGSGRFMNRGFGKMTGGINRTGRALTGRSKNGEEGEASVGTSQGRGGFGGMRDRLKAKQEGGPLAAKAAEMGPPKVTGSKGKKPGEWKGSKYLGAKG